MLLGEMEPKPSHGDELVPVGRERFDIGIEQVARRGERTPFGKERTRHIGEFLVVSGQRNGHGGSSVGQQS